MYAEWTGTFKGTLVGSKPFTQLVVYTDPALHPGWQQDPDIRANTHVRVEYFFDANNTDPDRIEVYTLPSVHGNTFVMLQNKLTPYYFGCYSDQSNFGACNNMDSGLYGPDNPAQSPGTRLRSTIDSPRSRPFPASVTCGKMKVQVYGQAGPDQPIKITVTGLRGNLAAVEQSILGTAAVRWGRVRAVEINLFVSVCAS